jgi:hypothetical protein
MRGMVVTVRRLALVGLRRRNPQATSAELDRLLVELLYGQEVARALGDSAVGATARSRRA